MDHGLHVARLGEELEHLAPYSLADRFLPIPIYGITIALFFRAVMSEPDLLPRLLEAPALPAETRELVRRRGQVA